MTLERLQLTNFRGFESLDLHFEPDVTVLVGVNGCGKTSVIDALLVELGFETLTPQDIRIGASQIAGKGSGADISVEYSTDRGVLTLVYGVDRGVWDQTPGPTTPRQWKPSEAGLGGRSRVGYADLFDWLREVEDDENERIRYEHGSENPQLDAVRNAIYRLLPGYSNFRIRRGGAMGDRRPRLTIEKEGTLLLFDALSEGERSLIALIADIARRLVIANPGAKAPLSEPLLLIIDEFEQHLHPQWQRELPSRLRDVFPGAQVILTTHSPIVVSELLPRQIRAMHDFRLLAGSHREGQDVNEILETLFGTPSRKPRTQALIEEVDDALDDNDSTRASDTLEVLEEQLGADDPEVVRLRTLERIVGAQDHDAVSEG